MRKAPPAKRCEEARVDRVREGSDHRLHAEVAGFQSRRFELKAWIGPFSAELSVGVLKKAGTNEAAKRSARTSINSFIRCARSLLAPKITENLKSIELASPLPFSGVKFEKKPSAKYYGTFDLEKLITKAREQLAIQHPERKRSV